MMYCMHLLSSPKGPRSIHGGGTHTTQPYHFCDETDTANHAVKDIACAEPPYSRHFMSCDVHIPKLYVSWIGQRWTEPQPPRATTDIPFHALQLWMAGLASWAALQVRALSTAGWRSLPEASGATSAGRVVSPPMPLKWPAGRLAMMAAPPSASYSPTPTRCPRCDPLGRWTSGRRMWAVRGTLEVWRLTKAL